MDFISSDVFEKSIALKKEADKVFSWTHLDIGKIFKVQNIETFDSTKFSKPCHILSLIDSAGEKINVWANDKLATKLSKKDPKEIPYISSLGLIDIGDNKRMNSFDLHFEKSNLDYQI